VTSVDLSNTYLAWAARNLSINGFSTGRHPLVRADALAFLAAARASGERWDLVVADPPTFSNSKASEADFDVNEDWPRLLGLCAGVLSPGGALYFSTNSRKLKWSPGTAAEAGGGGSWQDIGAATIPPDFRDAKAHDAVLFWDEADAMFSDRAAMPPRMAPSAAPVPTFCAVPAERLLPWR